MSANGGFTTKTSSSVLLNAGPYAVMLFFCISGYLITDTLCRHGNLRLFAFNRMARIYPLFLLLHLVMFSLGPWLSYEWMGELRNDPPSYVFHFLTNLLLLPGLVNLPLAQKNAWSLSYEAAFYLLAGTIYAGAKRWGTTFGVLMWVLGWIACVEACALHAEFIFFAIGALVWWLRRHAYLAWPSTGPVSLVCGVLGLFCLSDGYVWLAALMALPLFADVARESGWIAPILRTRVFTWLGKVSYSLYLVHPFVLDPLRRVGRWLAGSWGPGLVHSGFVVLGCALVVAAAAISYDLIEVRLTNLLLRRPLKIPA